jgi:hypothetical protein
VRRKVMFADISIDEEPFGSGCGGGTVAVQKRVRMNPAKGAAKEAPLMRQGPKAKMKQKPSRLTFCRDCSASFKNWKHCRCHVLKSGHMGGHTLSEAEVNQLEQLCTPSMNGGILPGYERDQGRGGAPSAVGSSSRSSRSSRSSGDGNCGGGGRSRSTTTAATTTATTTTTSATAMRPTSTSTSEQTRARNSLAFAGNSPRGNEKAIEVRASPVALASGGAAAAVTMNFSGARPSSSDGAYLSSDARECGRPPPYEVATAATLATPLTSEPSSQLQPQPVAQPQFRQHRQQADCPPHPLVLVGLLLWVLLPLSHPVWPLSTAVGPLPPAPTAVLLQASDCTFQLRICTANR